MPAEPRARGARPRSRPARSGSPPGRASSSPAADARAAGPRRATPRPAAGRAPGRRGRDAPGAGSGAEALGYHHRRWPAFVDGCKHIARVTGDWPHAGAEVIWDSFPQGRGRVLEQVTAYEARVGQSLAVEDEKIRGTQRVSFMPHSQGVTVSLELGYELKEKRGKFGAFDLLFVRRPQRESLERTLRRFAAELRSERDPGI